MEKLLRKFMRMGGAGLWVRASGNWFWKIMSAKKAGRAKKSSDNGAWNCMFPERQSSLINAYIACVKTAGVRCSENFIYGRNQRRGGNVCAAGGAERMSAERQISMSFVIFWMNAKKIKSDSGFSSRGLSCTL